MVSKKKGFGPPKPQVSMYTWMNADRQEAVLCFVHHVPHDRAVEALTRSMSDGDKRKGEQKPTLLFRGNHLVLRDDSQTHAPARLHDRARRVARLLGYVVKPVAPPNR